MSSRRYYNDDPYPFISGDTWPSLIFQVGTSTGAPADFTSYPNMVVTARFREKGASTSLAEITCSHVDRTIGQFRISLWPEAVSGAEEGTHELEIECDLAGDGVTVQTVFNLVKFRVYEQFGDAE